MPGFALHESSPARSVLSLPSWCICADDQYMKVLPSCTAGAAMLLGMSVTCSTTAMAAAYACLSRRLPSVRSTVSFHRRLTDIGSCTSCLS